ncbi:hypothetical protein XF_1770 [Xylella fastidiosa 9a5c]|uniref:Uncharacterized protein n=1 Tax=Xylella fastidiosa (strain 9a5c) TaxID=160492 RepID=Q9PCK8_XYLFA|nr:hypothetical protein XF_1770 [Xylella fastidiosa 9a5c]
MKGGNASGGADRWHLGQPFGDAMAHIQAELLVADACEQVGGLQRDQCRSLFDVGGQDGLAQLLAELERLRRRSEDLNLTAQIATVATELEQPRPAAMPTALELDGGQVMAVIEAGGDQKQGVQVGAAIELMVFDQVLQFPVLLGTEVRGQPFEQRRNRQLFVIGHGDAELCGQVFQTIQHIRPLRIIGLGDLGDVGLSVAGMAFVQREGAEQRLDDGGNALQHENARTFVVMVCHGGPFREMSGASPCGRWHPQGDGEEIEGHGLVGACPSRGGGRKAVVRRQRLTSRCSSPAGRR